MKEPRRPLRVLLLAGDVRGNMGDRAIRAALCGLLRRLDPDVQIEVLSRTPDRDASEFGARVVGASALALVTAAWRLRRCDFAVWGGGQLLQDDSSALKNVYWAAVLWWVRRGLRIPVLGLGLGLGPITTRWGRYWGARALRQLRRLVTRDERSRALAFELAGAALPVRVAPDLAWFLPDLPRDAARESLRAREGVELDPGEWIVGVAVRRWFHLKRSAWWPYAWRRTRTGAENARFERFLANLGDGLAAYARGRRVRLVFFPMASADWEADAALSRRVGERSGLPFHILRLADDAVTTRAWIGLCSLFVSVRMHSALLALSMGVPTVALYHVSKVRDLFESLGWGAQCLPLATAAEPDAHEQIAKLLAGSETRSGELAAALRAKIPAFREQERIYTDALAEMIARVRGPEDRGGGAPSGEGERS